ncbi:glycosyltransferase family 2 protein [Pseudomonadota bacterium]
MISIVILTYNEITNIERCLASVAWTDDVLVIDSGSSDGTRELAEKLGARILLRSFDNFANQRNFALDNGQLKYQWVLHLDADEVVTPELAAEMQEIAGSGEGQCGYLVPSRLMLHGQWLKHSGMYPSYQVRFGSRDRLRFHMVGHGQRELLESAQIGTLNSDLIHYNFSKGISEWLTKHARYARDEALSAANSRGQFELADLLPLQDSLKRRRSLKQLGHSMPLRPLARFSYVYFVRMGFLDGRAGFRYALLMAVYQWMIDLNVIELRQQKSDS